MTPWPRVGCRGVDQVQERRQRDRRRRRVRTPILRLSHLDERLIAEIDDLEREQGKLTEDPKQARRTARARIELVGLVRAYRQAKARRE